MLGFIIIIAILGLPLGVISNLSAGYDGTGKSIYDIRLKVQKKFSEELCNEANKIYEEGIKEEIISAYSEQYR